MRTTTRAALIAVALGTCGTPHAAGVQVGTAAVPAVLPDGRTDFDFELGRWRTEVKRLRKPLSGSTEWVAYEGTSVVHKFLDGRANLVELSIAGPAGRIEGVSLRLFHPDTRQWTIHYASATDGELTAPLSGRFEDGVGTFAGDDTFGGRPIRVRFVITPVTRDSIRFEQAFSADGGRTWEVNWIATDTRR